MCDKMHVDRTAVQEMDVDELPIGITTVTYGIIDAKNASKLVLISKC